MIRTQPLAGTRIVITRPAGTGAALARQVRALGGVPVLLPGSSLHGCTDAATRAALRAALASHIAIFTSPAAVRFAHRLGPLDGPARVLAPGAGTRAALRRAGRANVLAPTREDSEGILGLPVLQHVRGQRVALIGASGGRGLLERELTARGAAIAHAYVYQRTPARLDQRHATALQRAARRPLYVLLSSGEALVNILAGLPIDARRVLLAGTAIVSSERLAEATRAAGFARIVKAGSAHGPALLDAVVAQPG
ncbi:MAG TPA: uroporphyrinogen-III synthase [Rhodanobacteraceae bacterium]